MSLRRILVVGAGAREHALANALAASPLCGELFVAPGNGGTAGRNVQIDPCDVGAIGAFCQREQIDLVVVGPEAPLAAGIVDALQALGVRVFGPTRELAQLYSSNRGPADVSMMPAKSAPIYGVPLAARCSITGRTNTLSRSSARYPTSAGA